jgi:tetratricopeptide (TPR) repeat protein
VTPRGTSPYGVEASSSRRTRPQLWKPSLEELAASGEAAEIERRHAVAYLALTERARDKMLGLDQTRWLDRLEADHDDIRAAFGRAVQQEDASTADRLLWAVWRFWQMRGHLHEGSRRAEAALALPPADRVQRCRAYEAAGGLAYWQADFEACRTFYLAALDLARRIGDRALLADALYNSAFVSFQAEPDREEVAEGEAHLEEALALYRELGDRAGVGRVLWGQGTLAWMLGDRGNIERAAGLFEEASLVYREIDDVFQLGWTERMLGPGAARIGAGRRGPSPDSGSDRRFRRGARCFGGDPAFARLRHHRPSPGDRERALRLAGAMRALRDTTGTGLADYRVNLVEEIDQLICDAGEQGQRLLDEGAALPYDEVVAYALQSV